MMERRLLAHMRPIVGPGESAPGLDEFRAPLPHHHCGLRWPWPYDRLEERRYDRLAIIVKERPTQPILICKRGLGVSYDCLPAKQSATFSISAEDSKTMRMFAHFLRPKGTGEA